MRTFVGGWLYRVRPNGGSGAAESRRAGSGALFSPMKAWTVLYSPRVGLSAAH